MRLGTMLGYTGNFAAEAAKVPALEAAGLDTVWMPEANGFDAPSHMGYLAAMTSTITIASGIINVFTRTPTVLAMTAAGVDSLSNGRCMLGLGSSGPLVVEGFHGVEFDRPVTRTREIIEICRQVWARKPVEHEGIYQIPLPADRGTGQAKKLRIINHPVRADIPIFVASLGDANVRMTAEVADGWLPTLFWPERSATVWGDALTDGAAGRSPQLGPLRTCVGVTVAETSSPAETRAVLDGCRGIVALDLGGMGSRTHNFYNNAFRRYGYEAEATAIQDAYLSGDREGAAAMIPEEFLAHINLVGDEAHIRGRLAAYREAGVTDLNLSWFTDNPAALVERMRHWVDAA